jgi:hypothetical protein
LFAAALDPRFGHLDFISSDLRDDVWKELTNEAQQFLSMSFSAPSSSCDHSEDGDAAVAAVLPPQPQIDGAHVNNILQQLRAHFERRSPNGSRSTTYVEDLSWMV